MVQSHSVAEREQVIDTMVGLTRLSNLHRAIVAGGDSMELYLGLRRRGFIRVATTTTCRVPKRQHAVGLVMGKPHFRPSKPPSLRYRNISPPARPSRS
jgi:hypothetical protein